MEIKKSNKNVEKKSDDLVKFTDMNGIYEVMYMRNKGQSDFPVRKLNKDQYYFVDSGEIGNYKHKENRSQNIESLRKTFKKIRNKINYNFDGSDNELMITLTYAENMTDNKTLYSDYDKFMKKLKYLFKDISKIDYMSIVEPQERGAWHCHVLMKFKSIKNIYIPNKDINKLWGKGFVTVRSMKQVDNIGAYLSAYMGDVEYNPKIKNNKEYKGLEVREVDIDGKKKKFIKGGRLHMYPNDMKIYRSSRGIKEPPSEWIRYEDAIKKIGKHKPTYISSIEITDTVEGVNKSLNTINYEFYNLRTNNINK
jgi:hypothetical protein